MLFSRYKREKLDVNSVIEKTKQEPELELEKGDLMAIIIAAVIVILPVLLSFIGGVLLIYWLFIGRF
ncbi:MAG: hypothetical protein FWC32_07150 [Firmicutes bacterium]|nr:hypothetical protein [Bacillota bacterium]